MHQDDANESHVTEFYRMMRAAEEEYNRELESGEVFAMLDEALATAENMTEADWELYCRNRRETPREGDGRATRGSNNGPPSVGSPPNAERPIQPGDSRGRGNHPL